MKKALQIVKYSTLLIVLFLVGFYFYVKNYWKDIYDESELNSFITEVKSADDLPEKFYDLYEIEYESLFKSFNSYALTEILHSQYKEKPPSAWASRIFIVLSKKQLYRYPFKLTEISLIWEIEKRTSQRECLNWITEKYDFLNQAKGIKKASQIYFQKKTENLNDYELATLVIMLKNASLYNPFRRQVLIDKKVDELLKKRKLSYEE